MDESIRSILAEHGRLSVDVNQLEETDDLYLVGLSSHSTVNVMLALEDEFEIEIPEAMLRKTTFQSIAAIRSVVTEITNERQG